MNLKLLPVLALLFLVPFSAVHTQNVVQLGPNYYSAGIPTRSFQFIAVNGKQRSMNWCWAACIQMVLNYHGLLVTQEQVVVRCFGALVDHTGGPVEMLKALSGWAYNVNGRISTIYANVFPTNSNEVQAFLATNNPLIVGLNQPGTPVGHAYVLTAMSYSLTKDFYGNIVVVPDKVVLRDPWPTNPSRQEMSWGEFARRLNACYKVWIAS